MQHVGEIVGGGDPVEQRPVLRQHGVPVDVGHVRHPVLVPHCPASLGVGGLPERRRTGQEPGPGQVNCDPVIGAVWVGLPVGRHHENLVAVPDDQPGAVPTRLESVHLVNQLSGLRALDLEVLQRRAGIVLVQPGPALAEIPGQRLPEPGEPVLDGAQGTVPGLRHRHLNDPGAEPVQVDDHRLLRLARVLAIGLPVFAAGVVLGPGFLIRGVLGVLAVLAVFVVVVLRRPDRPPAEQRAER